MTGARWPWPLLPAAAMQSFEIRRPMTPDFWRPARCEEVDCPSYRNGWRTTVDTSTDLGRAQYAYITGDRTRRWKISDVTPADRAYTFVFEPGQQCFEQHRVPIEREAIYIVRGGDWRGNPTGARRVHARGEDFVDEWRNEAARINDLRASEGAQEMISALDDINSAYVQDQ